MSGGEQRVDEALGPEVMRETRATRKTILLWSLFLIGFPLGGVIWALQDARSKMERLSSPFVRTEVQGILASYNVERLQELGTISFNEEFDYKKVDQWKTQFGPLKQIQELEFKGLVAGGGDDEMAWQYVRYIGQGQFEKGPANFTVTVARRTMAPDWRIQYLDVTAQR